MRPFIFLVFILFLSTLISCQSSLTDYATQWTQNIKQKIIEDASQQSDNKIFDSSTHSLTFFKGDKKLRSYDLEPILDKNSKVISYDTADLIFYNADQNFELVRELCPVASRSFEGVRYKGKHLGLALLNYCDGHIKEKEFRYNNSTVGTSTEYDDKGNITKEVDNGNISLLKNLRDIKYYR
jgi:hypothetical protein